MTAQGKTTVWDGIEFRSRLEARWAAFFTRIGWRYTYEPFDGNGYIPDFVIHGDRPLLVEVKPAVTADDFRAPVGKIAAGLDGHWDRDVLIVGLDPLPTAALSDDCCHYDDLPLAGLIISDLADEAAVWHRCSRCHELVVSNEDFGDYAGRPCGHHEGDSRDRVALADIHQCWGDACNDVKWRPGSHNAPTHAPLQPPQVRYRPPQPGCPPWMGRPSFRSQ